jgi:hypothetical protein
VLRRVLVLSVVVLALAPAAGAAAAPRVSANPNPAPFGDTLTVKGRGWPVNGSCSRTVRLSLRSDQNAFRIGSGRVGDDGRFRFAWVPRPSEVGRGDWTLVARMGCAGGGDPVRATVPLRIGGYNLIVGRGHTAKARWTLSVRRGRFGGFCVGVQARPPQGSGSGPSGEGCGGGLRGEPLRPGLFYGRHRGTFAYGMAALQVARVEVRFGDGEPVEARLMPSPPVLGFEGRFWLAPFAAYCAVVSAEAFDAGGASLGRIEMRAGPPRRACPPA